MNYNKTRIRCKIKKQSSKDITRDGYYKTMVKEKLPFAPFPTRGGYNETLKILRGKHTQEIINNPENWKF
jgi:hypothetical protein